MKPLKQDNTPDVSGGIVDCEPLPIADINPLPVPFPGGDYPPAPITPVIEEPFITIKL